jgi:hypothetical protein
MSLRGVGNVRVWSVLLSVVAACWAYDAWSAGGAQIVDDSEVVEPGTCQVEMWVTRFDPGDGYANITPACTMERLPRFEIGATFQHYWAEELNAPLLGPSLKLNLVPQDTGIGIGLIFNAGVNVRTGDLGLVSALVPISVPLDDKVRFNFNVGWNYLADAEYRDALFLGAQVEAKVGGEVMLMLETFSRLPGWNGSFGAQMGLRYRPNDGPIDFDALVGGFFNADSARFFTLGVTVRF